MDQITPQLRPRVSINIATYNREAFLGQAIESVLNQSYTDWEMIIVDDGSTDNTQKVLGKYLVNPKIHYFKNDRNLGICATRNRAIKESGGEYIAILDSDDVWGDPHKLENQVAFLDQHPDYVLVGTGIVVVDKNGQEIKRYFNPEKDEQIRSGILAKNPFAHSSVLYRREVALALNGYPQNLNGIEDYDLWLRLGQKGKLHNLPSYSLKYRQHGAGISTTDRLRLMKENLNLVKKYQDFYPGFHYAWLRRFTRLKLAQILSLLHF